MKESTDMESKQKIDHYLNAAVKEGMYGNKSRLLFQMDTFFKGIDLQNKCILDVGGGNGLFSFYAACRGAKKVVCLEPEVDGSVAGMIDNFLKIKSLPGYRRRTCCRNLLLISQINSRWRGSKLSKRAKSHFSSASGSKV